MQRLVFGLIVSSSIYCPAIIADTVTATKVTLPRELRSNKQAEVIFRHNDQILIVYTRNNKTYRVEFGYSADRNKLITGPLFPDNSKATTYNWNGTWSTKVNEAFLSLGCKRTLNQPKIYETNDRLAAWHNIYFRKEPCIVYAVVFRRTIRYQEATSRHIEFLEVHYIEDP